MRVLSNRLLFWLVVLGGLAPAAPVRAAIDLAARTMDGPGVHLSRVRLHVDDTGDGGLTLTLHAERADIPAMGWRRVALDLDGVLQRDAGLRWLLDGELKLGGAPGGALGKAHVHLVIDEPANTLQVDLGQGSALASAAMPLDQPSHAQIRLKRLPAAWLQGLLATVWSGHVGGGHLDATVALDVYDDGVQSSGAFQVDHLAFDNPAGTVAGQGLGASGRLGLDTRGTASDIQLDASLQGGELLLGTLYAKLPEHAVQLGVGMSAAGGGVRVNRLRLTDPDALQLAGGLAFGPDGTVQRLRLEHFRAQFPAAYERYGRAWLATLGLRDLHVRGNLAGSVDLKDDTPQQFAFTTGGLDLASGDGAIQVSGLRGGLDWVARGVRPATTLGWRSLQLYRLPFGAGKGPWRSRDGALALDRPLDLSLFGGHVRLGTLQWRPAAAKGERLSTSLAVTGVDMAAFSKAMGWPRFPGTLGGAIPGLRWVDDHVELDGGLSVNVFDGFIDITQLALQQPFGASPVLAADVSLRDLDLAAMTGVFDFGSITGRLDGSVQDLRLVDWTPVAFRAQLRADGGGRISQRAVNNLTSVGGGGVAAGLQGAVLKLFDTFGYRRIGLSCVLVDTVCRMGGLESTGDGYLIVDGSGLPHLQVIGHQHRVDWPTLVARLKAATEGGGPQVR